MKKLSFSILNLCFLFVITACNNSDNATKAKDVAAVAKPAANCCFIAVNEGQQFFPTPTAEVTQVQDAPANGTILCGDAAETPSSFTKVYQIGKGKLTLRITDYCVNPRRLELDYERRHTNTLEIFPKDQVVKDLNEAAYKGFAIYSTQDKSSYLHVMVDNRFAVTIAGVDQTNFDDIFKLLNLVPIDKLASFKKG